MLLGALGMTSLTSSKGSSSHLKAETTCEILIYNSRFSQAVLSTSDVQELEQKKSQAAILGSHFALFYRLHASFMLMTEVIKTQVDISRIRKRRVLWKCRVACPS